MNGVIKIILSLLAALGIFLAGVLVGSWNKRKEVEKEVKKAIDNINKEHAKALESLKENYEKQTEAKDKIIEGLQSVIERLLSVIKNTEAPGADKLTENLIMNYKNLSKLK